MTEFLDTYQATVALLQSRLAERGMPAPVFETVEVAPYCFVGLPREPLLATPRDEVFLESAYFKLVDRAITPEEMQLNLSRLASGAITRSALLDEIDRGDDAERRSVRVEWT